jgi:hypothetical protein
LLPRNADHQLFESFVSSIFCTSRRIALCPVSQKNEDDQADDQQQHDRSRDIEKVETAIDFPCLQRRGVFYRL